MPTLLVIEDNELNRDMLSRRLTRRGYQVFTAQDGREGIAAALEHKPALILMDLSLPIMDGWHATRQLRAHPDTSRIPIVALTAHALPEDREKALAAGCDDFATKPVDLDTLLAKIDALIASR